MRTEVVADTSFRPAIYPARDMNLRAPKHNKKRHSKPLEHGV
jgi:hypothetical protein